MRDAFRPADDLPNIYLYRQSVDFRKSFRGLAAIVELELGHSVFDGGLYAFTLGDLWVVHDKIPACLQSLTQQRIMRISTKMSC
jgi:hypothetical protein